MAANSDGNSEVTTIVTCEGDLLDPRFPAKLELVIERLNELLGNKVKVHKLEPWNSVRVTLSIPREAALRLRQLANEGSQQLRALGILSVQVEGDQVISLRLADSVNSEPQEIILNTTQDGSSSDTSRREESDINFLSPTAVQVQSTASDASNTPLPFKSPNVVCPSDSVVPRVSSSSATPSNVVSGSSKPFGGPFPFTSMNQAIHGGNRESGFNSLPPPYPGKHPPVTISSPLLVNLLQNDGTKETINNIKGTQQSLRAIRTPPATTQKLVIATVSSTTMSSFNKPKNSIGTQADVLASNSVSPSALSTINTSIRKHNSTLLTSTSNGTAIKSPPTLPPQYHRGTVTTMITKQAVSSSTMKVHTSLNENHSQNTIGVSQHTPPSSNHSALSIAPHSSHQPQGVSMVQTHVSSLARLPGNDNSMIMVNSKSSQKTLQLPHVKTPISTTNSPLGRSPVMAAVHQKSIFNMTSINTNSLPTARTPSPQIDSLQTNEGSSITQQVKITENSFIHPSASNTSTISSHVLVSQGTMSALPNVDTLSSNASNLNSVMLRCMPSPPPYSVAISRPWDTSVNTNSLLDLTPSLTDLKPDELEELLPTLELTESPLPDLPDDFLNVNSNMSSEEEMKISNFEKRKFLINPLTGELEPQSSDESDHEELQDVFTGLRSPAALSDEDTCSTLRLDPVTDQSDNEGRSADKIPKLKNSSRDRGRDSPSLKQEKIKLRLKLEKSEPINPAYKVDVSYINSQTKKASMVSSTGEELRVPPLHISLRGRNSVVIKNKNKFNSDVSLQKNKMKKSQDHSRMKKSDSVTSLPKSVEVVEGISSSTISETAVLEQVNMKIYNPEQKKAKKIKSAHEHMEIIASLAQEGELKSKFFIHNHFKEKQKERRGSDSDLVRNNKKYSDNCGVIFDEKKRRLSQVEQIEHDQPSVVGSTNVGTITGLPQKPRKDKVKIRDVFKKDLSKTKNFCKLAGDKVQSKVVSLPVAGDMNMEAKFKQGLLEGNVEKNVVVRSHHRTDVSNALSENNRMETADKVITTIEDSSKGKMSESEKSSTPEMKSSIELVEKSTAIPGNRSPNTGGGQGEDSGIESMDALSEKSPNQASQSPHADIIIPKTQVPNILDIEAQLAKMEGLDRDSYRGDGHSTNIPTEDVNENKCHHDPTTKLNQCCELTCVLQDTLTQENQSLSSTLESPTKQPELNLKTKKEEENLEPMPVRITPALYTYSNPEKGRIGLESPAGLSDDDSNSCSTSSTMHTKPSKSLLEQLLIEIPNDHQSVPSSPSPATRLSVRTRALSKLESPELISPVPKNSRNVLSAKRKRNESDSSNHSVEDQVKKSKKKTEMQGSEFAKARNHINDPGKANNIKKVVKIQDESSDSDEPLIEKMKKSNTTVNTQVSNLISTKTKVKVGPGGVANNNNKGWMVNTRRSVRGNISAQNVRNKGETIQSDSEALRRKTRSTVIDVEKRKKEVK